MSLERAWRYGEAPGVGPAFRRLSRYVRLDGSLLTGLLLLVGMGMVILYSAGDGDPGLVARQAIRMAIGFAALLVMAQVSPDTLRLFSPWFYLTTVLLLLWVIIGGEIGQGARRWLDLGVIRFQPSELIKLTVPMMLAWFFHERRLPPTVRELGLAAAIIIVPVLLIAWQPDLGTALLVAGTGVFVVFLAGLSFRLIGGLLVFAAVAAPVIWHFFMHAYQRQRVLTLLNPESDPLGAGYHIIQSKIAIGSGGVYGKGWLNGTQSHLDFLPEKSTDFIFAVFGEEFGLLGVALLLAIYGWVVWRGLAIATQAPDTYTRLLAGSLTLSFFMHFFVNIGMVSGMLPVVGVPLPLISYGGTSMVTLLMAFGMLMAIHSQRRLMAH